MEKIGIKAKDGATIPAIACNFNNISMKGVVIVCYGFGEHSGMYLELADILGNAGYACILYDQRGHGAPPDGHAKWFGIINSYRDFLDDVASVTYEAVRMAPNVPVALYGHSMGGNIVINALLRDASRYSCAILEAPWLGLYKSPGRMMIAMAGLLGRISPGITLVNKLVVSDLSSDPIRAERYTTDPLYHNIISFRMFTGISGGCRNALANAARLPVPAFLAYASGDRIVCNQSILHFAADAGDMADVREYESCHAIHNDVKREDYFRDMIAFLDAHCTV